MNFKLPPMEHQKANFEFAKNKVYAGDLVEMGLGKSKMFLDVAANLFLNGNIQSALILCNSGAYQEWKEYHIPTHMTDDVKYEVMEWSAKLTGKKLKELMAYIESKPKEGVFKILTANTEGLSYKRSFNTFLKFVKGSRCLVEIDESSAIRNPTSARTKAAHKLRDIAVARRISTGSPIDNNPLNAWAQLEFLSRGATGHTSFYSFKTYYADLKPFYRSLTVQDRIRNKSNLSRLISRIRSELTDERACRGLDWIIENIIDNYDFKRMEKAVQYIEQFLSTTYYIDQLYLNVLGRIQLVADYKNLEEYKKMLKKFCFIAKTEDCIDLPEKVYLTRHVDLTAEQQRLYKQIKEEAIAMLSESDVITVPMILTQNIRCQQIVNGIFKTDDNRTLKIKHNRLKVLKEIIDETDEKVLIYSEIVDSIKEIRDFLIEEYGPESVVTYFGETSREDRSDAKKQIREGDARFFITNKTGAHGLTLVQITLMVMYDSSYDAEIDNQVQKRIHRIGQTSTVRYIRMIAKGTVDERKKKVLDSKRKLSSFLVESNWKELF